MQIKHVILGLLHWQPMSGYDLKKHFSNSLIFPWSGNNNQVYTALVDLHQSGAVTQQVQLQAALPARKIYSITETGIIMLRTWLNQPPQMPELRHGFLAQLAWADVLGVDELDRVITAYQDALVLEYQTKQEIIRRGQATPQRTPREKYLWEMTQENILSHYRAELAWINQLRDGLALLNKENGGR